MISQDEKGVGTATVVGDSDSLALSPKDELDVRVVLTIRKKMKEKLVEKIEDQWESFVNGIGCGIVVQLVSEEIDPGLFLIRYSFLGISLLL